MSDQNRNKKNKNWSSSIFSRKAAEKSEFEASPSRLSETSNSVVPSIAYYFRFNFNFNCRFGERMSEREGERESAIKHARQIRFIMGHFPTHVTHSGRIFHSLSRRDACKAADDVVGVAPLQALRACATSATHSQADFIKMIKQTKPKRRRRRLTD